MCKDTSSHHHPSSSYCSLSFPQLPCFTTLWMMRERDYGIIGWDDMAHKQIGHVAIYTYLKRPITTIDGIILPLINKFRKSFIIHHLHLTIVSVKKWWKQCGKVKNTCWMNWDRSTHVSCSRSSNVVHARYQKLSFLQKSASRPNKGLGSGESMCAKHTSTDSC